MMNRSTRFFKRQEPIRYHGPDSTDSLAFRWYDPVLQLENQLGNLPEATTAALFGGCDPHGIDFDLGSGLGDAIEEFGIMLALGRYRQKGQLASVAESAGLTSKSWRLTKRDLEESPIGKCATDYE